MATTAVVASQPGQPRRTSGRRAGYAMITTTAAAAAGARRSRANHTPTNTTTAAARVSSTRVPCASPGPGAGACAGASLMSEVPEALADHDDADHEQQHRHHRRVVLHEPGSQRLERPRHPLGRDEERDHG